MVSEAKLFFGGVPTDIDVRALRDAFPDSGLKVGQIIPYEEVEKAIKVRKESHRFKTVTNRWRHLVEKDSGLVIGAEAGKGFCVLDNSGKLGLSCQKVRTSVRAARRAIHVAGYVERKELNEEERARYDLMASKAAGIAIAGQIRGRGTERPQLT